MQVITIPKILFSHPNFLKLSTEAKVLYAILIDRKNQADKIGFLSSDHSLVTYTTEEICEDFCYAAPSVERMFDKLMDFGLIQHNGSNIRLIDKKSEREG